MLEATDPTSDLPSIQMVSPLAQMFVRMAVAGARRRLAAAQCSAVFGDFRDASGRRLADVLASLHRTGSEHLSFVRFVDGGTDPMCTYYPVMAFTEPGSHVIRICGDRFSASVGRDPELGDIMIIHELLHALGLGENPPASSEVTNQVRLKCGG